MKQFLRTFDILTFPKEDLALAEVRFTGDSLYYNDGNHTKSIIVTKERLNSSIKPNITITDFIKRQKGPLCA